MLKHFGFDIVFTLICLSVASWWGFSHGGMAGLMTAISITTMLAVLEISLSFDNAVVNASVLKGWSDFWKKIFLTVGILIAVFGMRLIFPIVIVAVTADLGLMQVVHLALNQPDVYADKLNAHHAEISAFGGMFLLLVFLKFMFGDKEHLWFGWLERKFLRFSSVDAISTFVALCVLMLSLTLLDEDKQGVVLSAGVWGVLIYLAVAVLSALLESGSEHELSSHIESNPETNPKPNSEPNTHDTDMSNTSGLSPAILKGGMVGFIYLEILDASFSFDGVIGAFAITNDVIIIMLGLAIGAMFVRSMTIYLVDKGTLSEYVYLEHGAHYAIGALAIIMLLSARFHIPELITGGIGIVFIGLSLWHSIAYNKKLQDS